MICKDHCLRALSAYKSTLVDWVVVYVEPPRDHFKSQSKGKVNEFSKGSYRLDSSILLSLILIACNYLANALNADQSVLSYMYVKVFLLTLSCSCLL